MADALAVWDSRADAVEIEWSELAAASTSVAIAIAVAGVYSMQMPCDQASAPDRGSID